MLILSYSRESQQQGGHGARRHFAIFDVCLQISLRLMAIFLLFLNVKGRETQGDGDHPMGRSNGRSNAGQYLGHHGKSRATPPHVPWYTILVILVLVAGVRVSTLGTIGS